MGKVRTKYETFQWPNGTSYGLIRDIKSGEAEWRLSGSRWVLMTDYFHHVYRLYIAGTQIILKGKPGTPAKFDRWVYTSASSQVFGELLEAIIFSYVGRKKKDGEEVQAG